MDTTPLNVRTPNRRTSIVSLAGIAALGALAAGCSSGPSAVRFQSLDSGQSFTQSFSGAYFGRDADGDYHAVLTDDGAADAAAGPGPLAASAAAPLRQVVLVHVLWTAPGGAKGDPPSATNAAIDWHVVDSDGVSRSTLHYGGAGFVHFSAGPEVATLKIRSASLSLRNQSGTLRDPLGRSTLGGAFRCVRNDALVRSEIERFHASGSRSLDTRPTASHGPPPRQPTP